MHNRLPFNRETVGHSTSLCKRSRSSASSASLVVPIFLEGCI